MTSIKVFAAPEIVHVNDTDIIFDSDYYASNNLDIVAEFGTDRDALLHHYITYGQYEGRRAYAFETESVNTADTNLYGNTMGNIFNDGFFVYDAVGQAYYFFNVYEHCMVKMDVKTGSTSVLTNKPIYSLNYSNGKLYGSELTSDGDSGSLVVCDVVTGNLEILHAAPVHWVQLVNNELYFTDMNDNLLRKLNIATGKESVLTTQPVYYPVVYKNQVIFQLDSDNESLYTMSKDGGTMKKLNNYHSHFLLIYNDVIYYRSDENGICRLRSMNLDGSEDQILMTTNFTNGNIYNDKYYFINKDVPNKINYIELSDKSHTIKELQLEPFIGSMLNTIYGASSVQVTSYSTIQFAGDQLLVLCREMIDRDDYVDEYLYGMNTNKVMIIPELGGANQTMTTPAGTKEQQALAVAQSIANSIPAGSDLERVRAAAKIVAEYCNRAVYTSGDPDYRTPYGVFCKGVYTCAGSTRALGLVLECMGYNWSHANENMYTHQWCELPMDGQTGWADGMGGIADYGVCPFKTGGIYMTGF